MKHIKISYIIVLLCMLLVSGCNVTNDQGTWTMINQMDLKNAANAAGFINESFGITVGDSGRIYYTPDKGQTWPAANNSSWCLFGLDIVDPQIAWACGNAANVRLSLDSGKNWQAVTDFGDSEPNHCRFIRFLDAQNGWIAGPKKVGATTDGGKTWTQVTLPQGILPVIALDLRTKDDGYLLDESGTLYSTPDRGKSWSSYSINLNANEKIISRWAPLSAIRFQNASHGTIILALEDATNKKLVALHTQDGGKTWKRAILPIGLGSRSSIFLAHDGTTLTHYDQYSQKPITVLKYK